MKEYIEISPEMAISDYNIPVKLLKKTFETNSKSFLELVLDNRKNFYDKILNNLFNFLYENGWGVDIEVSAFQKYIVKKYPELNIEDSEHLEGLINSINNFYKKTSFYIENKNMIVFKKYKPVEIEFKTSGKMILCELFSDYFTDLEKDSELFFNKTEIEIECDRMYNFANQGLITGYVGNSCPKVLHSDNTDEIIIGYETTGYTKLNKNSKLTWFYSLIDYDLAVEKKINLNILDYDIINIKPGIWQLTHTAKICSEYSPFAKIKFLK